MRSAFPSSSSEQDTWILERRSARNTVDPSRPYACFLERERAASGEIVPVATILLTNRECPWRCLMCDLWKNTLTEPVPSGAIPRQIDIALDELKPAADRPRQIKLYNSGSFFDSGAIPPGDHPEIARRLRAFDRVIVECHPALVNERVLRFRDELGTKLEIAMGLETIHPEVLPRLNKRMTTDLFARAAGFLRANDVALRVFVLVKPPFLDEAAALEWAGRSVEFAFDCGASVVSLIPTRPGNGALEALAAAGEFSPPKLRTFEAAVDQGISLARGRVFGDVWDLERFSACPACLPLRRERIERMNFSQAVEQAVRCGECASARETAVASPNERLV